MRFIAIASVSCASGPSAPRLIAPVEKRCAIVLMSSTSSSGTGSPTAVGLSRPRISPCWAFSSFTRWLKTE